MNQIPTHYHVFRELRTFDEFEASLRLRFEVFMEKGEADLLDPSCTPTGLDANGYDVCALHFGLFEHTDRRPDVLIGCVRFIGRAVEPRAEGWMKELLEKHPALSWRILEVPEVPFTLYMTEGAAMEKQVAVLFKNHQLGSGPLWEVSRLALKKERRSTGNGQRLLDGIAGSFTKQSRGIIFGMNLDYRPLLQSYVNYPTAIAAEFDYGNARRMLLYCDRHTLSPAKKLRIEKVAAALGETGQAVFHDDLPDFRLPRS